MNSYSSQDYWSKRNNWFLDAYNDNLYERIVHSSIRLREKLAILTAKSHQADSILDIGCGHCKVLANAMLVTDASFGYGLDFSQIMLDESRIELSRLGLLSKVELDKVNISSDIAFPKSDISFALGLFDYVHDYCKVITKAHASTHVLVASWPEKTFRNYLRTFRYKCPVYRYNKQQVLAAFDSIGIKNVFTFDLGFNSGFVTITFSK